MVGGGSLNEIPANLGTDVPRQRKRKVPPHAGEPLGASGCGRIRPRPTRRDWNPVPVERLLFRAPLALEVVRARLSSRSAAVESGAAVGAGGSGGLPIQQPVRTEGEGLPQARRPRHHHTVLEPESDEPAARRTSLP